MGSLGIAGVTEDTLKIKFSDFARKNIMITVSLNKGRATATVYTCDLSCDYVKINGAYN